MKNQRGQKRVSYETTFQDTSLLNTFTTYDIGEKSVNVMDNFPFSESFHFINSDNFIKNESKNLIVFYV